MKTQKVVTDLIDPKGESIHNDKGKMTRRDLNAE